MASARFPADLGLTINLLPLTCINWSKTRPGSPPQMGCFCPRHLGHWSYRRRLTELPAAHTSPTAIPEITPVKKTG
jgi:hypothetical protein